MSEKLSVLIKKPSTWIALVILGAMGIGSLYLLKQMGYGPDELKAGIDDLIDYISEYPALVYLSVLLVGGLPLPLSPFIILAGVLFTNRYGLPMAFLICYSAMVLNMIWTYFLSAYPLRSLFEKILLKFADKFPEVPEQHKTKFAFLMRITPGIPFFVQNYALGVNRIPIGRYLLISCSIQVMYTAGFVIGGGAIFEGKAGLAIAAIALIAVLGIVINIVRSRSKTLQAEV